MTLPSDPIVYVVSHSDTISTGRSSKGRTWCFRLWTRFRSIYCKSINISHKTFYTNTTIQLNVGSSQHNVFNVATTSQRPEKADHVLAFMQKIFPMLRLPPIKGGEQHCLDYVCIYTVEEVRKLIHFPWFYDNSLYKNTTWRRWSDLTYNNTALFTDSNVLLGLLVMENRHPPQRQYVSADQRVLSPNHNLPQLHLT